MNEAIAAVIAIIGGDATLAAAFGGRVRTGQAAQIDVRPYCLVWNVITTSNDALDGETDLDTSTVQIDVYADRFSGPSGANALTTRIRDVIAAFKRGNVANVFVASILRTSGPRQYTERFGSGADESLAKVSIDYRLHHRITRTA
ncbi:MAG: tail completion protein gp17 [Planctomycetaceae bacterium]